MMTREPLRSQHLGKLDILRGVAILLVFLFHCELYLFPGYEITTYTGGVLDVVTGGQIALNFFPIAFGWSGVMLFLLISGFVIHLGYLNNQEKINFTVFYSKRFWRIWPVYLLVLLFFCLATDSAFTYFFSINGLKVFIVNFLLIHNLYDKTFFSINPSFWSLALEMQLYLLYPIILWARKKTGMKNVLVGLWILSLLSLFLGISVAGLGDSVAYTNSVIKYWFVWGAGAFLAEKYFNGTMNPTRSSLWISLICFFCLLICKYFLFTKYFLPYIAVLGWMSLIEWFISRSQADEKRPLWRYMSAIGACSYSIYLIHQPYLSDLLSYFGFNDQGNFYLTLLNISLKMVIVFVIIFLISYSLYLFVELNFVKLGKQVRDRMR